MRQSSGPNLLAKRLHDDWMLLLSVFAGIIIATALGAGAPLYLNSLEQLAFDKALDRLPTSYLDLQLYGSRLPLTREALEKTDSSLAEVIEGNVSEVYLGHDSYLKGSTYLVGLPTQPLPGPEDQRSIVSRGYFQFLSGLGQHSRFLEGRMAESTVWAGPRGPMLEAVVGTATADEAAFDLHVGDVLTFVQDLGNTTVVSATIVGILEPDDLDDEYWVNAFIFLDPSPLEDEPPPPGVRINADEAPVALFVTRQAMVEAFGRSFPGTMVKPISFIRLDKERLKGWTTSETRQRLQDFRSDAGDLIPGAEVAAGGAFRMISDIKRRSFFSKVPLLLLLTVLVVTVLLFVSMMVSFLVQSREGDAALWRTRGAGFWQVMRLYVFEGLAMTAAAVVIAPFLALGTVALAGKLPYFTEMTGARLLPARLVPDVFLGAVAAGILCVAIFAFLAIPAARGRLLTLKLRLSRPPTTPLFHRYFVDVVILVVGGVIFWELNSRGQIVSGGLFGETQVNEAMLLAPVLFLIMVALVFMRIFPLLVSYVSGESPALTHLLVAATVAVLGLGIAARDLLDSNALAWLGPVAVLLTLAAVYWATGRLSHPWLRLGGLPLQTALVAAFLVQEPPTPSGGLLVPAIALIAIVPAQLMFLLLRSLTRVIPVWLSISMLRMARNPFQYSWLVLLLVMTAGVGVLSTTVGETLRRSRIERVLYDAPSDLRVNAFARYQEGGTAGLKGRLMEVSGMEAASLALRTAGSIGPANVVVLAVESPAFSDVIWYRDDFSANSLSAVMSSLRGDDETSAIVIPEGATALGVWARPESQFFNLALWIVVRDGAGAMHTLDMGSLQGAEWQLVTSEIPPDLEQPVSLISLQFFEGGASTVGRLSGAVLIDDIHVTFGEDQEAVVLDGFEAQNGWTAIPTSLIASDTISLTSSGAHSGRSAAAFAFGVERNMSIRGIYQSAAAPPVPVVLESSIMTSNGIAVGDTLLARIAGRLTPVVVRGTVDYFPTLGPGKGGFVIADLNSLLSYVNIMGYPNRMDANEIFANRSEDAGAAFEETLDGFRSFFVSVSQRSDETELARLDPLGAASWRAAVLLALAIVLTAAALGYASYVLSHTRRSRVEIGFLQSLGLSRRQLMGVLGIEHLTVSAIGLGLGTWAGFRMTGLMVSPLTVTEAGEQVVPPFILTTDWQLMLPTYAAMAAIFLATQVALNRSIARLDLVAIARLGD